MALWEHVSTHCHSFRTFLGGIKQLGCQGMWAFSYSFVQHIHLTLGLAKTKEEKTLDLVTTQCIGCVLKINRDFLPIQIFQNFSRFPGIETRHSNLKFS